MEVIGKEKLEEMAQPLFKQEGVDTLFATVDGQFFVKRHHADNHAGLRGTVHTFTQKEKAVQTNESPAPLTVKVIAETVATIEDKGVLQQMLDAETSGPNRSTAVKAIQDRIIKLTALEMIAGVEGAEALQQLLDAETAGDNRSIVIKTIQEQIAKLSA